MRSQTAVTASHTFFLTVWVLCRTYEQIERNQRDI